MKPKYVSGSDDERGETSREIIIEESEPTFTGLYDAEGRKLYRVRERVPFGFVCRKERA